MVCWDYPVNEETPNSTYSYVEMAASEELLYTVIILTRYCFSSLASIC